MKKDEEDDARCGHCGKRCSMLCAGCKETCYCDSRCQKAHWASHKVACRLEAARLALPSPPASPSLLDLSAGVLGGLIAWLDPSSLSRVDAALTCHARRARWQEALRGAVSPALDAHPHCVRSLKWVADRQPRVRVLHLSDCNNDIAGSKNAGDPRRRVKMSSVVAGLSLPALTELDCSGCAALTDAILHDIVAGCPNIEKISLYSCGQHWDCTISAKGLGSIADHCPRLVDINLGQLNNANADWAGLRAGEVGVVFDEGFRRLGAGCPLLRVVKSEYASDLSDAGIAHLAAGCPSLRVLHLDGVHHLTDASCRSLAAGCPLLEDVAISLKGSEKGWHWVLSSAGLRSLVAGCKQIKRLTIGGGGLDGEMLSVVARGCPCLEELTLSGSGLGLDAGLAAIADGCVLLKEFSAWGNECLTDRGVACLTRGRCVLSSVNIDQCPQVTSQGVVLMLQGPGCALTVFGIGLGCATDAVLACVAERCPMLKVLRLEQASGVTARGLAQVLARCPRLAKADGAGGDDCGVGVYRCDGITQADVDGWERQYPRVLIRYQVF